MGKILVEKLLRSCPGIGLIYILVRPKKGVKPEDRIKEFLESPVITFHINSISIIIQLMNIQIQKQLILQSHKF